VLYIPWLPAPFASTASAVPVTACADTPVPLFARSPRETSMTGEALQSRARALPIITEVAQRDRLK